MGGFFIVTGVETATGDPALKSKALIFFNKAFQKNVFLLYTK